MINLEGQNKSVHCVFAVVTLLAPAVQAMGAVLAVDASIATVVQELIDGRPASVNAADDSRQPDGSNVPLLATADVVSTDLEGILVAQGRGFAVFADPTRLDQPNPEELALEAACYSNAELVSYLVTASTVENRTLLFNRSEFEFAVDGTRVVESRVFLSGAMVFWSTAPGTDLSGTSSEISFSVSRVGVEAPLFQARAALLGNGGSVSTQTEGPIQIQSIRLDELAERGVDADTIAILQQVADEGSLIIIVIPLQEHAYHYVARAGESFELTARLDARIRNAPNGTGAAVAMGRPFGELAEFIEQGLPGVKGALLERALNEAMNPGSVPDSSGETPSTNPRRSAPCGVLGAEAIGMMLAPLALLSLRRRIYIH